MSAWNSEVAIVTVNLLLTAASIQTTCSPDLEYLIFTYQNLAFIT